MRVSLSRDTESSNYVFDQNLGLELTTFIYLLTKKAIINDFKDPELNAKVVGKIKNKLIEFLEWVNKKNNGEIDPVTIKLIFNLLNSLDTIPVFDSSDYNLNGEIRHTHVDDLD